MRRRGLSVAARRSEARIGRTSEVITSDFLARTNRTLQAIPLRVVSPFRISANLTERLCPANLQLDPRERSRRLFRENRAATNELRAAVTDVPLSVLCHSYHVRCRVGSSCPDRALLSATFSDA